MIERTVWRCNCIDRPLVLHGDNGSPLKGSTVQAMMARLGITPLYSRPRVSDDNAFVESLFRTCKYVPNFPRCGFASLDDARRWVQEFVDGYNHHHLHRGIRFVTPEQRYLRRRRHLEKPSYGISNGSSTASGSMVWRNPKLEPRR
ncbi:MAG: transposase [Proteobacteria bacterium]|nr:MAG: transposase [Pseudomonadota bacterium]